MLILLFNGQRMGNKNTCLEQQQRKKKLGEEFVNQPEHDVNARQKLSPT